MKMRQVVAVALGAVLMVGSAMAHSKPKTMMPAANATVEAPKELSVFFTEALDPKFSSLALMDADGKTVSTAKTMLDPKDHLHLTLALPKLKPGVYTVEWKTAAEDGHKAEGKYPFTVK